MKQFLTIVLFFFLQTAVAQDLSGVWEGVFGTDMSLSTGRRTFFMHLEIKQTGKKIEAVFYNAHEDFKNKPTVLYKISGAFDKKNLFPLRITNSGVLDDNLTQGVADVFNYFQVYYKRKDSVDVLYGNWYPSANNSPRSDGAGGSFRVIRKSISLTGLGTEILTPVIKTRNTNNKKNSNANIDSKDSITQIVSKKAKDYKERKDSIFKTVYTVANKLTISLYDNGLIDGDIVSLYINDSLVLLNKTLSDKPIVLSIDLVEQKKNKITLVAENLGNILPNTAFAILQFGKKDVYQLYLSTDYNQNACIIIAPREE